MIELLMAAALAQAADPDPNHCFRAPRAVTGRPGCPEWRLVSRDARGARYFAPASAVVEGGIVEVMTRTDLPAPVQGATLLLALMRLDCSQRTFSVEQSTGYSDAGVPVINVAQVAPPRPVRPGDGAAILLDEYCAH